MRLSVFSPKSSTQLLIDLGKIYQDYFTEAQLTPEALQALVEDEGSQLYATMFNERHLGAVQVTITDTQAQLSLLTIRDLTRRKGIAKNLLKEVEKRLIAKNINEVTMSLTEIKEEEKQGLKLFMASCGYQLKNDTFYKYL